MTPKPTMRRTTPRRMSERARTTGGGAKRAAGTGWPFSTIVRTVRCRERDLQVAEEHDRGDDHDGRAKERREDDADNRDGHEGAEIVVIVDPVLSWSRE